MEHVTKQPVLWKHLANIGCISVHHGIAHFGPADDERLLELRVGDEVTVDAQGYLAAQTYHRHQVPGPEYPEWDQFRRADGTPLHPQRPLLLGPLFAQAAAGTVQVPSGPDLAPTR